MSEFASYPVSISERKAEASQKANDWTPRDAIISLLRDIDSGEADCDAVVICYRQTIDGETKTHFNMAAPNALVGLGLLNRVSWMINET